MKTTLKPYRFISAKELTLIQEKLHHQLRSWSQTYAIDSMEITVSCLSKAHTSSDDLLLLKQAEEPLALIDKSYLLFLKQCLFAETSACFDSVCELLFFCLVKQLLTVDSLELISNSTPSTQWFYPGSPCLLVTLSNKTSSFKLYLHPNWVLTQLPQKSNTIKTLAKRSEALATQEFLLTIELAPFELSLGKLLSLQVGDVIKISHLLIKPLFLCSQRQRVCEVELGQFQSYKSVQLLRSL